MRLQTLLGIPKRKVRVIFYQGAGAYGTNDTDDVAAEAAWIAQQIGQPVRLQWMRDEGIAWDPKGPPHLTTMRAGIDSNGKVIAWDYNGADAERHAAGGWRADRRRHADRSGHGLRTAQRRSSTGFRRTTTASRISVGSRT